MEAKEGATELENSAWVLAGWINQTKNQLAKSFFSSENLFDITFSPNPTNKNPQWPSFEVFGLFGWLDDNDNEPKFSISSTYHSQSLILSDFHCFCVFELLQECCKAWDVICFLWPNFDCKAYFLKCARLSHLLIALRVYSLLTFNHLIDTFLPRL